MTEVTFLFKILEDANSHCNNMEECETLWCMQVFSKQQEVSCCSLAVDFVVYPHGQLLELLEASRGVEGTQHAAVGIKQHTGSQSLRSVISEHTDTHVSTPPKLSIVN